MAGGRPRTSSLSPEEMITLGEEMVSWVKEHKPTHLTKWWKIEKDITDPEWDTMRKAPEFFHYYAKALLLVGYNYLDKDTEVDGKIKDRWQRVYFKDLREEENETTLFNAQAGAIKSDIPPNDLLAEKDRQIMSLEYELKKLRDANKSQAE